MLRILLAISVLFSINSTAQIKSTNFETGLFRIIGPEISSGDYNSLSLGFDVKKAEATIGFNYINSSYSETDYTILEFLMAGHYPLFEKDHLIVSAGMALAYKAQSQQSFMNNTFKSLINPLDVRPYIDISYSGHNVSPYIRGYRGLLNLETADNEYFVNQQIALGLKWQLNLPDDE